MAKKKVEGKKKGAQRRRDSAATPSLDARAAVRHGQHLASQLHQLLAAALTLAELHDEPSILAAVAESARDVFAATRAVVRWDAPELAASADAGADPVLDGGSAGDPTGDPDRRDPWVEAGWLCAPLRPEGGRSRGLVAVRREAVPSDEDPEVLTLLAQTAATALVGVGLARGVANREARLRVLVETAPIGLVEVGPEGAARWWNGAASRVLAWPTFPTDATPEFPSTAQAGLADLWREVTDGATTAGREIEDVVIGQRRRLLTVAAAPLPPSGDEAAGVLTLIDDVTDTRQLRAEVRHAQTMETRGQIASRLAHDFNNLLTLASGYAEILSRDLQDDDRSLKMVKDIQSTMSRASLLTSQLQTIGRTKAPTPVVFDPVTVIASNAEVLERILGSRVEVGFEIESGAGTVKVDADQFEQMVLNLSINARDAMPSGGRLTIGVARDRLDAIAAGERGVAPGDYVRVRVADTGVGMDDETRRQCFDALFTTKGPFRGTGMGLASAQRLVTESGGVIEVASTPGEGSTFDVYLPRVGDPERVAAGPVAAEPPHGSATVLVADDDDALRHLMVQVLSRNGYRVIEASSGEAALSAVDAGAGETLDLLVSDVVMGDLDGRELAGRLRDRDPSLKVLLTSGTADETILDGLGPVRVSFLAKPFRPSGLIDAVHELLARG
ncbi:MAG TPA: ATP-binding protein [Acidimicrobiales bacterium]|nr:ATP-binding protein [Acidimicrobiales bacterium]